MNGDYESVCILLGLDEDTPGTFPKAEVEAETPDGLRAIHLACDSPQITKVLLSLEPPPDVNAPSNDAGEWTPLTMAVTTGPLRVIELLLEAGADVNQQTNIGITALHFAMDRETGVEEVVRCLREHGAGVTTGEQLCWAIQRGQDEVAADFLDPVEKDGREVSARVDPNLFGGPLHSPLQAAVWRGNVGLVAKLLEVGARPEVVGGAFGSALHAAVWEDMTELVGMLLEDPIPDVDDTGEVHDVPRRRAVLSNLMAAPLGTPLHALYGNTLRRKTSASQTAALLVSSGADINACDTSGRTALALLSIRQPGEDAEADALIGLGAGPDLADETGAAPLHYAASQGCVPLLRALMKGKAMPEVRDGLGRTVLSRAASQPSDEGFRAVLEALPAEERRDHMADALAPSLKAGCEEMGAFEAIVREGGIDLSRPGRMGWTALDVAWSYGLDERAALLESKGAVSGAEKRPPTALSSADKGSGIFVSEDGKETWLEGMFRLFHLWASGDGRMPAWHEQALLASLGIPGTTKISSSLCPYHFCFHLR